MSQTHMKHSFFVLAFLVAVGSWSQALYFPPNGSTTWETISPEELGYCSDEVDALYQYLEANNTKSFILLKDGKIVLERYFGNFQQEDSWYWASAGKTLTATLIGIAVENNVLSLNDNTTDYLGAGWSSAPAAKEDLITLLDHLQMTTGFNDGVLDPDCSDPSCLQYIADAGDRWAYHNGPYNLLHDVLETSTGVSLNQYLDEELKSAIGMTGIFIDINDYNTVYFSNARSMARFGLFLLAQGTWDGTSILTETYISDITTPSQSFNESYGLLTWLNGDSFMLPQSQLVFNLPFNENSPSDMFAAMGRDGQLINVIPSENLVWIRIGEAPASSGGLIGPVFNNEVWAFLNELNCTLAIDEENDTLFRLYPNPARDTLRIDSKNSIEKISIFDISGRLLLTQVLAPAKTITINISGLNSGTYLVQATSGKVSHQQRFVKL